MEEYMQKYNNWINDSVIDEEAKKELKAIAGNDEEINRTPCKGPEAKPLLSLCRAICFCI